MVGSIAGLAGAFSSGITVLFLNMIGMGSNKLLFLNASIFLKEGVANTTLGLFYGFILHLLVGSIIGIVFMYFFPHTGRDYLFFKGLLLGGIAWLFIGGVLGTILNSAIKDSLFDGFVSIIINLLYSLLTIYLANYLYRETRARN